MASTGVPFLLLPLACISVGSVPVETVRPDAEPSVAWEDLHDADGYEVDGWWMLGKDKVRPNATADRLARQLKEVDDAVHRSEDFPNAAIIYPVSQLFALFAHSRTYCLHTAVPLIQNHRSTPCARPRTRARRRPSCTRSRRGV
jgi:hypothetical protein